MKREYFVYGQRKVTFAVYVKKTTIYAIFHFINKIHATIMLTKNNSSMGFIFYCCDSNNTHFCINNTTNKIREHQKNRRTKNELKIWGNHKTDVSGRKSTDDVRQKYMGDRRF